MTAEMHDAILDLFDKMAATDDTQMHHIIPSFKRMRDYPTGQSVYDAIIAEDPEDDWRVGDLKKLKRICGV